MRHDTPQDSAAGANAPAFFERHRLAWPLLAALGAVAVAYVLFPLRDTYRSWNDFRWVYVSGKTWLAGASPYDFPRWAEAWLRTPHSFFPEDPSQPFLYPPHWAVLAIPFATLPYGVAIRLWDVVSVAAAVATIGLVARMARPHLPEARARVVLAGLVVLAIVHGSLRWSLWESQLAVVPMLGVVGAFDAWRRNDVRSLVVFALLASLKPQVGALPLLFLFVNGGHRGILAAGAIALAISVAALAPFGLASFPADLADCYARHMNAGFNQKDSFSNLSALFATMHDGARLFWVAPALAMAWLGGVTAWRRTRPKDDPIANDPLVMLLLVGTTIPALLPLHGYDLVVESPLVLAAVLVRPRLLAILFVALVELAGRAHVLERIVGFHPLLPLVTSSIMIVALVAVAMHARSMRPAPAVSP